MTTGNTRLVSAGSSRAMVPAPVSLLGGLGSGSCRQQVDGSGRLAGGTCPDNRRMITWAAAIMICVFAAFMLGDLRVLRVVGLGMAAAILLDATLVRMVLMPSLLQLMWQVNWWFPGALERAAPSFLSEPGTATKRAPASPTQTSARSRYCRPRNQPGLSGPSE